MKNKCVQLDCMWNSDGTCTQFREPVWKLFGTEECKTETDVMFRTEAELGWKRN